MSKTKRQRIFNSFQHGCEVTIPVKPNLFAFSVHLMHYQTVFYNLLTSLVRRTKSIKFKYYGSKS